MKTFFYDHGVFLGSLAVALLCYYTTAFLYYRKTLRQSAYKELLPPRPTAVPVIADELAAAEEPDWRKYLAEINAQSDSIRQNQLLDDLLGDTGIDPSPS